MQPADRCRAGDPLDATSAASRRRWARVLWVAPLVPFALGWVLCFVMHPEAGSLAAPLLGPWAGYAYGHSECTMASTLPEWSLAAVALGVVAAALWVFLRKTAARSVTPFVLALWALLWVGLALLSTLNTLE